MVHCSAHTVPGTVRGTGSLNLRGGSGGALYQVQCVHWQPKLRRYSRHRRYTVPCTSSLNRWCRAVVCIGAEVKQARYTVPGTGGTVGGPNSDGVERAQVLQCTQNPKLRWYRAGTVEQV